MDELTALGVLAGLVAVSLALLGLALAMARYLGRH